MMRYLLILVLGVGVFSCSNAELETLKAENEALRVSVQENKMRAEESASHAKEAEAKALLALKEAEKQRQLAKQSLEDCKKK
jgi:hypothetical protein